MGGVQSGWIVKPGEVEAGRQIGLGSVGVVYKGLHIPSGRIVAVKVRKLPNPNPNPVRLREADRETGCWPWGC
jgi:serine/threonine protein kinase